MSVIERTTDVNATQGAADPDRLIATREAAELLRVSVYTATRYAREGKLAGVKAPGGRHGVYLFRLGDVVALRERMDIDEEAAQQKAQPPTGDADAG